MIADDFIVFIISFIVPSLFAVRYFMCVYVYVFIGIPTRIHAVFSFVFSCFLVDFKMNRNKKLDTANEHIQRATCNRLCRQNQVI